jgi:hypothetical protein
MIALGIACGINCKEVVRFELVFERLTEFGGVIRTAFFLSLRLKILLLENEGKKMYNVRPFKKTKIWEISRQRKIVKRVFLINSAPRAVSKLVQ